MKENNNSDEEKINNNSIINSNNKYDLKEVNDDNIIDNYYANKDTKNISNNKNNFYMCNINVKKQNINYSLIIQNVLSNILNYSREKAFDDEYKINLLLLSSLNNLSLKTICLYIIFTFNEVKNNFSLLKYVVNKMNKFYENNRNLNRKIFIYILKSYSEIAFKQKQYFHAYHFLKKAINYSIEENDSKEQEKINEFYIEVLGGINKYIISKKELFKDKNVMNENKLKNLNKILGEILMQNNEIKNNDEKNKNNKEENNDYEEEYGTYLFAISKKWVMQTKIFIDYYNISLKEMEEDEFLKNAFNEENILNLFFNESKDKENSCSMSILYPGPINNYDLVKYKDAWEDPINEDENYYIKDKLVLNKDYYLISQKNWIILNEIFDSTNEIKRIENNNIELIQIKALILERRLKKKLYKNLLRTRYMQIRKNSTVKKMKEKIIRYINFELQKIGSINDAYLDEEDEEEGIKKMIENSFIKFYIIDKENKNILIEICTAFSNDILIYNSVLLKEIIINEEKSVKYLFDVYNKKNHILIIEIGEKVYGDFLQAIKPISNENNSKDLIYQCNICDNLININKRYQCGKCSMSILCKETCFKSEGDHINLHKKLSKFLKPEFNLDILRKNDSLLNSISDKGVVGLYNLGNTCYANSVIQCLSNTLDFAKYFVLDFYKNEQNFLKYNFNSDIVEEFSNLLKKMWLENDQVVSPRNFLISFFKLNPGFRPNVQQDAQEFLSSLFLNLHERLNRTNGNIEFNYSETNHDYLTEIEKNKKWSYLEKLKNDSFIYDLFNGEFISNTICLNCGKNITTFEQFNILSLPIPEKHYSLNIKYFSEKEVRSFPFSINGNTIFAELKDKALIYFKKNITQKILKNDLGDLNNLYEEDEKNIIYNYNNTNIPKYILYKYIDIVILNNIKMILYKKNLNDNDKILPLIEKTDYEIVLYEKQNISKDFVDIYITATYFNLNNKVLFFTKTIKTNFCYPILLSFEKNIPLEKLVQLLKNKFSNILNLNNIDPKEYSGNPIQIIILHYKKDSPCTICGSSAEQTPFCNFENLIKKNFSINELKKEFNDSSIILAADSKYFSVNKKCIINHILFFNDKDEENESDKINIYDCLEKFREEEILDNQNKYFCENCKASQIAKKKIQIYKLPLYLIIQLKRFKYNNSIFSKILDLSNKIETHVEMPEILDLKEYIFGPEKNNWIYELYGSILHKEDHYVSICKNEERWILYNDDSLYRSSFPQSKNCYLLFYKKKN